MIGITKSPLNLKFRQTLYIASHYHDSWLWKEHAYHLFRGHKSAGAFPKKYFQRNTVNKGLLCIHRGHYRGHGVNRYDLWHFHRLLEN